MVWRMLPSPLECCSQGPTRGSLSSRSPTPPPFPQANCDVCVCVCDNGALGESYFSFTLAAVTHKAIVPARTHTHTHTHRLAQGRGEHRHT